MSEPRVHEGGCLCGKIRWRASGKEQYAMNCHCRQCTKQTGSAFGTGAGFKPGDVTWVTEEPTFYQSSPNVKRGFCSRCGSSISWHYLDDDIALLIGSFDHPEAISPSAHMMADQLLPWLKMDDGLPRYPKFPPDAEYQDQGL